MKKFQEDVTTKRQVTLMRWAAKDADLAATSNEDESSNHAREAVQGFVASAQLRANAERLTGNTARTAQHEAYVTAEKATASLDKAQHHATKAREQKILGAYLRLNVAIKEVDGYGGASAATDAPLTFSMFRPALNRRMAVSLGDAS